MMLWAEMVTSEQSEVKNLFQRTGQPLTVFIMAPPDGFTQKLDSLNREAAVLRPLSAGDEPVTADVWIFFVDEVKDIVSLPGVAKQVFESTPTASESDVLRYAEFTLGDGSKKAAVLIINEKYSGSFQAELPCIMAVDAFNAIYGGFTREEFQRRRNECAQGS